MNVKSKITYQNETALLVKEQDGNFSSEEVMSWKCAFGKFNFLLCASVNPLTVFF